MPRLISLALFTRRDPRILKIPPFLSLTCVLVGVAWLFMLPLDQYSRHTYISENALLPGQVHTYFGGSDQNVFRAYRHEVEQLEDKSNSEVNDKLEQIFRGIGLKVGRQNYTYHAAGEKYAGENIYAILQAPRGDATEAIVLLAAWRNVKGDFNRSGLALVLALTRYFKRWSLWSKDIILVIPPESRAGTQAWVDAYHDSHDIREVSSLPLKSGALQGAIAVDYPFEGRFEGIHIVYDGVNGQLPNLDLINSVVNIASGQMGMSSSIQEIRSHSDQYGDRLATMLRGMVQQGLGHSTGPHSSFIPYHVDAITIQPTGEGWHDEMGLGRLIEGTFRSLNNLLEHLHQSFFFYLLMQKERFVSIGTYLPSAMLIAANFTIMAITMWVKSGYPEEEAKKPSKIAKTDGPSSSKDKDAPVTTRERELFLPLVLVAVLQFAGSVPLFLFNNTPGSLLLVVFVLFAVLSLALPYMIVSGLSMITIVTSQHYQLVSSFSLLLLGMFLSTLATLNFSLAFLVGLLATPLSFVMPIGTLGHSADGISASPLLTAIKAAYGAVLLVLASPPVAIAAAVLFSGEKGGLASVLKESAFGWHVWGMYTPIILWCVWWPAWVAGSVAFIGTTSMVPKKVKKA